ncbi:MAG: ParB N-terminal domain-containing protein, partial [Candidatus Aminicenantes bacterium]|nr:ParB N-terminal domain-containing protein [Candidatus Aminicenantes bacterium]
MIKTNCSFDKMVAVGDLQPNPRNPNRHPAKQIELLAKIIKAQGWRAPITVSNLSGLIVRGHGRYLAAQLLKVKKVPVDYQDYDNDAQEWADLVADNKIAEFAHLDADVTAQLIREIEATEADIDMDITGF